jgi:hypothetical protein
VTRRKIVTAPARAAARLRRDLPSFTAAFGFAGTAVVAPTFALTVAPVFVLVLFLLRGRTPGAELIDRLRSRRLTPRRRRWARPQPQRQYLLIVVRRTGRLIASALAMRPPPVSVTSS